MATSTGTAKKKRMTSWFLKKTAAEKRNPTRK